MAILGALAAFILAAGVVTVTPGLDTALVLRTAMSEGRQQALLAALGILLGCLVWGVAVALGLGLLLKASAWAFDALRCVGAAYLFYVAFRLLLHPRSDFEMAPEASSSRSHFWRGLLTNLLNPKVGVFYVSFLPQFIPPNVPVALFSLLLAVLHTLLGALWFAGLVWATEPLRCVIRRPGIIRWLDRATGLVFMAFGLKLAAHQV